jgi:hypothetical protein
MSKTTRREFIRRTGIGVAGLTALNLSPSVRAASAASRNKSIPDHRAIEVPGIHAYPMEHSVAAGDTLELCVSASVPYSMSMCRLGLNVDDPAGDTVLANIGHQDPNPQPIHPGSYVYVARSLRGSLRAFTVECWVRPWDITKLQGVVSQEDKDSSKGFALGIGKEGYVGFFLGDGVSPDQAVVHRTRAGVVARDKWNHLAATWDGKRKRVFVNGVEVGGWDFVGTLEPGSHPLRVGAMAQGGVAGRFLDGDVAMPVIYSRALDAGEVKQRFEAKGLTAPRGRDVLGCWPLREELGDRVADVSGHGRHGRIINHATWMIGGPGFKAAVERFGKYNPKSDDGRGHGLRFASDDLYDCRWAVTHRWKVPADARVEERHGCR